MGTVKNKTGLSAMHLAANNGHLHVLEYLIQSGGDPNDTTTTTGNTVLMEAAINGHINTVQYLIDSLGCDTQVQNCHDKTVLDLAIEADQGQIIQFFNQLPNNKIRTNTTTSHIDQQQQQLHFHQENT